MKLPNANLAVVEKEKVFDYLLIPAHPDNGGKAAFFLGLGFSQGDWQGLAAAFGKLAGTGVISKAWNLRMAGSMFWMAASNRRAGKRRWCGRFGILTVDRMRRDW